MIARTHLLLLGALLAAGCLDPPDYTGRACSEDAPCPEGYQCGADRRCAVPRAECTRNEDCVSPGACQRGAGALCTGGECRYAAVVCDDPPADECSPADDVFRTWSASGRCEPSSGTCSYTVFETACPGCRASCLEPCSGMICDELEGGCRRDGRCAPGAPPICAYTSEPDGTACTLGAGGLPGVCQAGECVGCRAAADCDDANPCTADACNTTEERCEHTPVSGVCDDGNACTQLDTCADGRCAGSDPVACDSPPDVCHAGPGTCDPADGSCTYPPAADGTQCEDGNLCTSDDQCSGGDCVSGPIATCDDENDCTDDSCDPATGCANLPNSEPCSDGTECTAGDTCSAGGCVPGAALECDDGNPCTAERCDAASGCVSEPLADGLACTFAGGGAGVCGGGACVGCNDASDCDDGNICTTDTCDGDTCVHTANTAACNDGNLCTHSDRCSAGTCRGTAITCTSNTCVTRACNGTASCTQTFHSGRSCADDGNACTTDVCDGAGRCTHPARANGASCGAAAASRCCGGSCVNISTNASHCGGCGRGCGTGFSCESISVTTSCDQRGANVSGRCRCNGANAQCPSNQLCRTVSPYTNRCTPANASGCPVNTLVELNSCPDFCRY